MATKKKDADSPYADKIALYEKLVATNPEVERKGDTIPYTSLNGNMFSYFTKDGFLALRLGKEDIEAFLKKYKTKLCEQYGIVQKEYAVVPDDLLKKTKELQKYFDKSYAYVKSLKPKPTKKAAKKKA
jgi:TfoX/Sxy family transcriptional regulator of competence genes